MEIRTAPAKPYLPRKASTGLMSAGSGSERGIRERKQDVKLYVLKREQTVLRPIEEVFDFFKCPENLSLITPPSLGFVILTPLPIHMQTGSLIDYSICILGLRRHWTTLITDCDPPHRFSDVQLKGPYEFWHHTHRFESVGGGTRLTDEVRYILPLGPLGRIAHSLIVRRQLDAIFDYRQRVITERFGYAGQ
jgi:ligand-binding SRPBCC domain-containing protein